MTGELFEVLSQHSVLQHSLSPPARAKSEAVALAGLARRAFQEGVEAARSAPLLGQLFRVRTRQVLHGHGPEGNRAFLSGLLIGAELVGLKKLCASSVPLVLCGGEFLTGPYEFACQMIGAKDRLHVVSRAEAERLSLLGQAVVLNRILASKS